MKNKRFYIIILSIVIIIMLMAINTISNKYSIDIIEAQEIISSHEEITNILNENEELNIRFVRKNIINYKFELYFAEIKDQEVIIDTQYNIYVNRHSKNLELQKL
jgi:hypothetical protein